MNPQRQRTNEGGDSCMVADLCPTRCASPKKKKKIKRNSEEHMQEIRKDTENDREHKQRSLRNNERHFERKKIKRKRYFETAHDLTLFYIRWMRVFYWELKQL